MPWEPVASGAAILPSGVSHRNLGAAGVDVRLHWGIILDNTVNYYSILFECSINLVLPDQYRYESCGEPKVRGGEARP